MSPRRALAALLIVFASCAAVRGAAGAAAPEVRTLDNGLRVAFLHDADLPVVEIVLAVPAGTAAADTEAAALAWPMAELLTHGTTSRDARAFADAIEGLGGRFSSQATREHAVVAASFLAHDFEAGMELVSDAVLRPAFAPSEVDRVRRQAAVTAVRLQQSAAGQAERWLWAEAFPDHPYGAPAFPEIAALRTLTADRVRAFHVRMFDPSRSVLAIGGDITAERAFAAAAELFGGWQAARAVADTSATRAPVPADARPRIVIVDRPNSDRAEIRLGFRTPARGAADEPPIALAVSVLADGPERRFEALERSTMFSGGVRASRARLDVTGFVSFGTNVPADSAAGALDRLRGTIANLASRPPSDTEMETARRLQVFAARQEGGTLRDRLTLWCVGALQGAAPGWDDTHAAGLERAAAAGVAEAAGRWFAPPRAVIVVFGPAETMVVPLSALGDVEALTADGDVLPRGLLPDAAPPGAEAIARGKELVKQALAAHGGAAKLRGIKDSAIDANVNLFMPGQALTGTMRQVRKEPYRMQMMTWIGGVESRQVLDGDRAWGVNTLGDREAFDLDTLQVAALRDGFESDLPHILLDLTADGVQVRSLGRGRFDDRDVDRVAARNAAGERWIVYLESGTHRLAGVERREPLAAGAPISRRIYRDYRPVKGIPWPHDESRLRAGALLMRIDITGVALDSGIPDTEFRKPVTPGPLEDAPRR